MKELSTRLFVLVTVVCAFHVTFGNIPVMAFDSVEGSEIIVSVINGRVRSEPNLTSAILKEVRVGTRLQKLEATGSWYKVELEPETEAVSAKTGWISKTISSEFDAANADAAFQKIADKYLSRKSLTFTEASQIIEFLGSAADDAKTYEVGGDLRLKRLLGLSNAIGTIKQNERSPYKEFLEKYNTDVIYHEPAGKWIVRSERFWELHNRYKNYKIGEEIAWRAAKNPLPGECEGYIVCHVNYLRVTSGEYLNFYPSGKYAKEALDDITNLLDPIMADLPAKTNYITASDITDRAEFNKILSELRTIVSKTPFVEKSKTLAQIAKIAEGHR